jgi:glycosyltransferase involved in cell wall biosynthesis
MTRYVPGRASVVIPCFNASRYLREAIESALAQTHRDVEIVVCDDGFARRQRGDRSVLRPARAVSPSGERRTVRPRGNRALAAATGEYVALLDADDRFHAPKLERQIAVLAERPEVGAVYLRLAARRRGGTAAPEQGVAPRRRRPAPAAPAREPVPSGIGRHAPDRRRRRRRLRLALSRQRGLGSLLRAGRTGIEWAVVDEALCDYRIHPGQSHERLSLVHGVAREILERFFADPDRAGALRRLEPAAFEHADLRAAAELYAAAPTPRPRRRSAARSRGAGRSSPSRAR